MNKNNTINKVRETFKQYSQEQKMNIFTLMWNGFPTTRIPIINSLAPKMPGVQYKRLYQNIERLKMFYTFKEPDLKVLREIEKQLLDFYKCDLWTQRTRHFNDKMKNEYPIYLHRVKKVLENIKQNNFVDTELFWIENDLLNNVRECEEWEKDRMLKEFGIK